MKLIVQKYKNISIYIVDDNFTYDKKLVLEFCDALEKENLKVKWSAGSRVSVIDEEMIKRMKECGCYTLEIGIESGSQTILNNIKKQTTVEQNKNSLLLCKKYGMPPIYSFIIGNQGENYRTAMETYKFIKEFVQPIAWLKNFFFFLPIPFPKTELYEYAKKIGLIKNELKLIKSFKKENFYRHQSLIVNFSELSDKKLLQLKISLERLIRGKLFFNNYFLDMTLGKYFKIIFISKGLKAKIKNILKLFYFYYHFSIYFKLNLFQILKLFFHKNYGNLRIMEIRTFLQFLQQQHLF